MAVMTVPVFNNLTNRLAAQYNFMKSGIEFGSGIGVHGSDFDIVTAADDYDVEYSFITPSHNYDTNHTVTNVIKTDNYMVSLISSLDNHLSAKGYTSVTAYLSGMSIKTSTSFAELYNRITSKTITALYVEDRAVVI